MAIHRGGVLYIVNTVPLRRGTTRYQHANALCGSFETTILSRGPVPDEVGDEARGVYRFQASILSRLPVLFPLWLLYWVVRLRTAAVVVGPHSIALLSAYVGTRLSSSSFVVDLWDDLTLPIASYEGRDGLPSRLREWYHRVLYHLAARVLPRVDLLILSIHPGIVEKYDLSSVPVLELTNGYLPALSEHPAPQDDGQTRIVYLGRANAKRGIDAVIRTVATDLPGCHLDVVGPADEAVTRVAAEFDSVTLYGERPQDEAIDLVARADIGLCILDTTVENYRYSYPIKLFEYAALGKAIVASDTPAVRSVLTPGESVRVVGQAESIGDAVTSIVDDKSLVRRLGEQARTDVRPYTWPTILEEYIVAIDDVVEDGAPTESTDD